MSEETGASNGTGGNGKLEFKTPLFSASIGGKDMQLRDFIGIATLMVVVMIAIGGWQMVAAMTVAIRDLTGSQKEQVQVMKEQTCLISLSQEKREVEYWRDTCKRLSR